MLTNEEIIERYGNHPENDNYNDELPEEYIICENCPAAIISGCAADSSIWSCDGFEGCYNRIRSVVEKEQTPDPTADVPQKDKTDAEILYICDQRACEVCDPNCRVTKDIRHAKNFVLKGRAMVEVERDATSAYTV